MQAWIVDRPGPMAGRPLVAVRKPIPEPALGQVRIRVRACGVCRTDLHLALGELAPRRPSTVPGHEVVGVVEALGAGATRFVEGDRIGAAWLRGTCGRCRFCRTGRENLCPAAEFTGWDAGYRALKRAELPPGGRLGIYGFGASAHVVAQLAIAQGAVVHVLTRSAQARELAMRLGAASAGPADGVPPELLDSAVLFAPAGGLVPIALRALEPGGTLAVAGIYLSDVPRLEYASELFREKQLRSVTANTRADGEEFLRLASRLGIRPTIDPRPLSDADQALADLSEDKVTGAAVLIAD